VPAHRGGLGWGTGPVSLVLTALIAVLVAVLAARQRREGATRMPTAGADSGTAYPPGPPPFSPHDDDQRTPSL
jgi:hypothetical protein